MTSSANGHGDFHIQGWERPVSEEDLRKLAARGAVSNDAIIWSFSQARKLTVAELLGVIGRSEPPLESTQDLDFDEEVEAHDAAETFDGDIRDTDDDPETFDFWAEPILRWIMVGVAFALLVVGMCWGNSATALVSFCIFIATLLNAGLRVLMELVGGDAEVPAKGAAAAVSFRRREDLGVHTRNPRVDSDLESLRPLRDVGDRPLAQPNDRKAPRSSIPDVRLLRTRGARPPFTQLPIQKQSPRIIRGRPSFACPTCGSPNIEKASVIYEAGTRTTTSASRSASIGIVDDTLFPIHGRSWTTSTEQSVLAAKLSPPAVRSPRNSGISAAMACLAALCLVLACALAIWFFVLQDANGAGDLRLMVNRGCLLSILGVLFFGLLYFCLAPSAYDKELVRRQCEKDYAAWDRSFLCRRCGKIFQIE